MPAALLVSSTKAKTQQATSSAALAAARAQ